MATTEHIIEALGGRRVLGDRVSTLDQLDDRVRAGLPYATLEAVMTKFGFVWEEVASTLKLPRRTLARRKKDRRLQADESDRLFRLARIGAQAADILGDDVKAARWLHRRNRALGNRAPVSLLDTDLGTAQVEAVLGRIEHGVFS